MNTMSLDVVALNEGKDWAFHQLYTLYYRALVNFAMQIVGDRDDAEDIVQENITILATHPVMFTSEQAVSAWLYSTVRNRCLNHLKHKKVESLYAEKQKELGYSALPEDEAVFTEEVYRQLFATIDELPPRSREVLLKVIEGMRNSEIAEALGMSIETVKTHRKRGMAFLRQRLGKMALILLTLLATQIAE